MKILVTGANGFIASAIVEALLQAGNEVVACARTSRHLPASPLLSRQDCNFVSDTSPEPWLPRLKGVHAVINSAGILREKKEGDFQRIHVDAPLALLRACEIAGVGKFVQLSALGSPADGEFIASKWRFDEQALNAAIPVSVIRPSVVVSTRGSYGGTSMLRALAALPGVMLLPGDGGQRIQPVLLEDLASMVVACLAPETAKGRIVYAVGPEPVTLKAYLVALRAWLRFRPAPCVSVPKALVRVGAWLGERLGAGPFGKTITGMLERGNVASPNAWQEAAAFTGIPTRDVPKTLAENASYVQDRWQARLYWLAPISWFALVAIWLVSGLSGLLAEPKDYAPLLAKFGLPEAWQRPFLQTVSVLDLVLGTLLLFRRAVIWVLWLMAVSIWAYTLGLTIAAPYMWLDATGGLLKNLAVLVMLAVYAVLREGR